MQKQLQQLVISFNISPSSIILKKNISLNKIKRILKQLLKQQQQTKKTEESISQNKQEKQKQLTQLKYHKNPLNQVTWILDNNQWRQNNNIKKLFTIAQSFPEVIVLWLSQNYKVNIIQELGDVFFPSLKKIFLFQNNIESIQSLLNLSFPILEELYLRDNYITNVSSLRRLYLPRVQWIKINNNYINCEYQPLTQLYAPRMRYFFGQNCPKKPEKQTQYKNQNRTVVLNNHVSVQWCFKMQSNYFVTLKVTHKSKLIQGKWAKIFKRYKNIN